MNKKFVAPFLLFVMAFAVLFGLSLSGPISLSGRCLDACSNTFVLNSSKQNNESTDGVLPNSEFLPFICEQQIDSLIGQKHRGGLSYSIERLGHVALLPQGVCLLRIARHLLLQDTRILEGSPSLYVKATKKLE